MRVRFGGIVLEIERKGLITILILSSLIIGLFLFAGQNVITRHRRSLVTIDDLKNNDYYLPNVGDEAGEANRHNSADEGDDVRKKHKKSELTLAPEQHIDSVYKRFEEDEQLEEEEGLRIEEEKEDQFKKLKRVGGRGLLDGTEPKSHVIMAMDTLSRKSRYGLARAAKSMSGPGNRPPDKHYNINVTLSDMTSLDRELPDTRPPVCATIEYNISALPKVSIVIPFFNEAPTMLLRNIQSILNRSPDSLLEEIILVDDLSYDAPLKEPLERYVKNVPRISLLRNEARYGLIVSRMRGARAAKAPVIIFLDAHSEVNVGWLEPLLYELMINPKQVLQPFIDGVDNMNLVFSSPPVYYKGAFSWDLRYTWLKLADHEQQKSIETGQPFFTPTLVGCALAVMKEYFFDIGSFDEGMYVWGGENLELAFRTWMCGGQATTVTCSRVGHVFKQSPNKFDGTKGTKEETVQKNLIRVADVWMDGMRKFFYGTTLMFEFKRMKLKSSELETLAERSKLRKKLKCQNFEWYLYNVIPEMLDLPPMDSVYFGEIMNLRSRACWEVTEDYFINLTYFCFEHKVIPKNNFALMKNGLLKYRDKCVKISPPDPFLKLSECPEEKDIPSFGSWELVNQGQVHGGLKVSKMNNEGIMVFWCLVQVTNAMPQHKNEQMPELGSCNPNDGFQVWSFTYGVDFSLVPEYLSFFQPNLL